MPNYIQGKSFKFIIKTSYGNVENNDPVLKLDANSEEREKAYRKWIGELVREGSYEVIDVEEEDEEWMED